MLDAAEVAVTVITLLLWIVGLWSAFRRRQLGRRVLRSLTEEQRQALRKAMLDPPKSEE
jgi:hypothetical protein